MRITKIERQKRNRKRYSISIDGEYSFSCHEETFLGLGLEEGQQLSPSEFEVLLTKVQRKEAEVYSVATLARRPMTEAALRNRLAAKGYHSHIISSTLERLKEIGLIDDLSFSRLWIRDRTKINPRGTLLLRRELRMKGVAPPTIEKALEEFKEKNDESRLLIEVAERRAKKLKGLDSVSRRRRLFNYLLRRGFPMDEVRKVTQRY
jgi:regulatory protein